MDKYIKATVTGDVFQDFDTEDEDYLYFLLKDETGEFAIGLSYIIQCLKFAGEQGEIPKFPDDWWCTIAELFPRLYRQYNNGQ